MIGLIEDTRKIVTHGFKGEGDIIALLGVTNDDLSVSEYAGAIVGRTTDELIASGRVPQIDLSLEKLVQDTCLKLVDAGLLKSAHDCSDGGLAVAIAESCFSSLGRGPLGAEIELLSGELSSEALLFSESPSRIVVSFASQNLDSVMTTIGNCPFNIIGKVGGGNLDISIDGVEAVSSPVAELESAWRTSLQNSLQPREKTAGAR
jgi:phosphoribosylformylglycinamidine synthase